MAKAGYSLVEVTLALLVAGLGLMAVFSLFPAGLDASRRSTEDTEVSAFADFVLAGAENAANFGEWNSFADNQLVLNQTHMILAVGDTQKVVRAMGANNVDVYLWIPWWTNALAYQDIYAAAAFTYSLDVDPIPAGGKSLRLEVWPGDKRAAVSNRWLANQHLAGSTVFYREFYRPVVTNLVW